MRWYKGLIMLKKFLVLSIMLIIPVSGYALDDENMDFASRDGGNLYLILASGEKIKLENSSPCDNPANCVSYILKGMIADNQFFNIEEVYYEWVENTLTSRKSGKVTSIYDSPRLSSNKQWIMTADSDENGDTNGIYIWKIDNGELVEAFQHRPSEYEWYQNIIWNEPETIKLNIVSWKKDSKCPNGWEHIPAELLLTNSIWHLEKYVNNASCVENQGG
jgi:hypothetical protein